MARAMRISESTRRTLVARFGSTPTSPLLASMKQGTKVGVVSLDELKRPCACPGRVAPTCRISAFLTLLFPGQCSAGVST